ncbi:MAG: fluoride efflux transporter CrcB [Hyphomicrobium sp.]|jgi:CrcB protein
MRLLLLACLGGAVGSGARHLVNITAARMMGIAFPWGTLTVNLLGCFLMGVVIEALALKYQGSLELRTLIATGFLGGFTTFSAFSLDVVSLMEKGETAVAVGYAAVSVGASIVALVAGLTVTRLILA